MDQPTTETPKYIALIRQMAVALDAAYNFIEGFEDDDCQEDMSFATEVKDTLEAAKNYISHFNHLTPAVLAKLKDVEGRQVSAINSDNPAYVAVIVEGGNAQTFVTNIPDLDIKYVIIDYDMDAAEDQVQVRLDQPEFFPEPLRHQIDHIERSYDIDCDDGQSASEQLMELGL